jgi:hypothetical protein
LGFIGVYGNRRSQIIKIEINTTYKILDMKLIKFKLTITLLLCWSLTSLEAQEYVDKPHKILALGGIAIHPSQTSYYVMGGFIKKRLGGYLKIKSDLNFDESYTHEGSSSQSNTFFTGNTDKGRYAFTGGGLFKLAEKIIIQFGLGYGKRWVNWEIISGDTFRVSDLSYKGIEGEVGCILNYKIFVINSSFNMNSSYKEVNIGIGLIL